jgi:transposase
MRPSCARISTPPAPAPRRAAGGEKEKGGSQPVAGEALGRSRGGLTTKIHLAGEGKGRPLAVVLSEGQRHESTQLEPVLDRIRVPRQSPDGRPRRGRPRKRPERLLLDKGYAYPKCRRALRRRGIPSMIPERKDQRQQRLRKGSRGGRPCRFSREEYRQRSWIERLINRLKQWRRIATRYEKRAQNYQAFVLIGCLLLWLEH